MFSTALAHASEDVSTRNIFNSSEIENFSMEYTLTGDGATEITGPIYDGNLLFSHSLTLENDISINFTGQGTALSAYDTFYLECKVRVYNGNAKQTPEYKV